MNLTDEQKTPREYCELYGWDFQEPYTISLRAVVTRRRQGCTELQAQFWMAEATTDQKQEAIQDALQIMEAKSLL